MVNIHYSLPANDCLRHLIIAMQFKAEEYRPRILWPEMREGGEGCEGREGREGRGAD